MKFGRTAALFMTLITLVGCRTAAGVSTLPVEPPLPLTLVPVPSATPIRLVYGPDVDNVGELYLPDNDADSVPVVVMVHGGGWLSKPDMTHFRPLAEAVAERGIAVWNIEYRRERNDYKDTLTDIDNAIDILATTAQEAAGGRLDLDRVQVAGHSAGGQLAAWAASRHTLPASAPWAQPRVKPRNATIMAGVFDMARAARSEGDRFVPRFLGGMPDDIPERYALASPIRHLPTDVTITAIHGDTDKTVSAGQSLDYIEAARLAGDRAESIILPGVGHGDFLDPRSIAWSTTVDTITAHAES
ncbi:S9 family peptidase [Rhodococcus sp. I2R]|uniref:alpha/beta hydrolase family protein n=1 Tax=Rhodococcus sp. I2R TaxID=2855445 RepID=UPI001E57C9ED|nr:alpha/beta fold hydrolase [Rhodococcus sp. I2R]